MRSRSTRFLDRLLEVVEFDILPLTRQGVESGNKVFGAAVLRSSDLSLVVAGTNEETESPLWHGEIVAIRNFYQLPGDERPDAEDCLFLSTHEPCSMCLSAITWAGFRSIYYLFGYEQTRDLFQIPHDLQILQEVFRCEDGNYARENRYWESHDIVGAIERSPAEKRVALLERVEAIRRVYAELSERYQSTKSANSIPLP